MICRHAEVLEENGVPIHRTWGVWPFSRYFKAADYFSVQKLLRKIDPDVVYCRVNSPYVGFAANYCHAYAKKLIYHIAHIDDLTPMRVRSLRRLPRRIERPIFDYGLRRADIVIAQADYQAELLQTYYHRKATDVIPNFHPVPTEVRKSENSQTVLWVANLKPAKQPELFVKLAERCAHLDRTKFIMVGAIQDSRYNTMVEEWRNIPNLTIVGPRSLEEVNILLEQAHLFVNSSRRSGEGFPNTFIQAWLRSTPVVSLEVNPDSLLDSLCCGICANGSFDSLVNITLDLLNYPDRLTRLGEQSLRFAESKYSLNNCARILSLIDNIATCSDSADAA
jgi:glycosyltransferase involved in cell wall biosynthesis